MYKKRFSCSGCDTEFCHKATANSHIKRKNGCSDSSKEPLQVIETLTTSCPYCSETVKTMTSTNFMEKHLKKCANKPDKNTSSTDMNPYTPTSVPKGITIDIQNNRKNFGPNTTDMVCGSSILRIIYTNPFTPEKHVFEYDSINNTVLYCTKSVTMFMNNLKLSYYESISDKLTQIQNIVNEMASLNTDTKVAEFNKNQTSANLNPLVIQTVKELNAFSKRTQ